MRSTNPLTRSPVATATALVLAVALLASCSKGTESPDAASTAGNANPIVVLKTTEGEIDIELFADKAPLSVANFLSYVDEGFYDGTVFHRVIKDFMVQGGGYDGAREKKPTREPIKNEASNGLKNEVGTVAMARTSVPDSATSQFFINTENNAFLDHRDESPEGYGYAVFGKVIRGLDVVEKIEATPTDDAGGAFRNFPKSPIVIESARRKP
jgi:cyclophilin family peptidyl-prolyl cis-trans isomerase